jgi:Flp pilus assembly CpaE family ATPase
VWVQVVDWVGEEGEHSFTTGPGSRAGFLLDIPFLGRIPIDPHMGACADAGDLFLEWHPESGVARACNLIIEKIKGGNINAKRR